MSLLLQPIKDIKILLEKLEMPLTNAFKLGPIESLF